MWKKVWDIDVWVCFGDGICKEYDVVPNGTAGNVPTGEVTNSNHNNNGGNDGASFYPYFEEENGGFGYYCSIWIDWYVNALSLTHI